MDNCTIPQPLAELELRQEDIVASGDGFYAVRPSVAQLLERKGITTFPNAAGEERRCDRFYDDWYLYALDSGVCSLFKMREQERDAEEDIPADGDSPGVTVSFIAMDSSELSRCLRDASRENRAAFNRELNRVVVSRGQRHDPTLKAYFADPRTVGALEIGRLYTELIAALSREGELAVPDHYALRRRGSRLPRFIDENNRLAGRTVCDHRTIFLQDPRQLTVYERHAILATHTANTSFASFAAEVQFHARWLTPIARVPLFGRGHTPYDSAIRADLSVDDRELQGFTPYYNAFDPRVRQQRRLHPEYDAE